MKDWIIILIMIAAVTFVLLASWHINVKRQIETPVEVSHERR